jgi:hyperosmotically inducible protein
MLAKTLLFLTVTAAVLAQPGSQSYINREVQHELLMLPYFTVFDNITYQVNGDNVVLSGQVVQPMLKDDAGRVVKRIEGVQSVENHIEVLPTSPIDDGIRLQMFRAIYGFPALEKYSLGINKAIRIIVKGGHVTLEGVVDSEADKNVAGIRANSVPDVFSVTNNLQVVSR